MEIEEHLQIKDMFLDHSIIVGKFRTCQYCCVITPDDSVDRKLDLLVDELACYGIAVAGIQETKYSSQMFDLLLKIYIIICDLI